MRGRRDPDDDIHDDNWSNQTAAHNDGHNNGHHSRTNHYHNSASERDLQREMPLYLAAFELLWGLPL